MSVNIANADTELRKISAVLRCLRPAFDSEGLISQVKEQMQMGYQVAYVESEGEVLCIATEL